MSLIGVTVIYSPRYSRAILLRETSRAVRCVRKIYKIVMRLKSIDLFIAQSRVHARHVAILRQGSLLQDDPTAIVKTSG